ncbi:type I restriction endonuclease [Rivularia sp. UHCC 0363]|uniref:type I restriction endonuclease n=1 Tax=Rivularia sp. UHCC 0363 TaxID=3110244 RepID=UPI002B20D81F|nr:type I restriction endonuclease [Rivularia sp. UHCC 0363]MEA5594163.1 type I restriction endonuclease [Rivularia sp. UHCC 0363]
MVQTIQISDLTLHEVKTKFGLQENQDDSFFREWQDNSPELTELEKQQLDQIKKNFLYLSEYPTTEEVVKLVVLSPLLSIAGFYSPPFRIPAEVSVQIALEAEGELVRGRIDVLVLQDKLWVAVVESKEAGFSLKNAISQALAYMIATPTPELTAYGFVTNGSEFRFIKLVMQPTPQYGFSDLFTIQRRENELYIVVGILKRIGELIKS